MGRDYNSVILHRWEREQLHLRLQSPESPMEEEEEKRRRRTKLGNVRLISLGTGSAPPPLPSPPLLPFLRPLGCNQHHGWGWIRDKPRCVPLDKAPRPTPAQVASTRIRAEVTCFERDHHSSRKKAAAPFFLNFPKAYSAFFSTRKKRGYKTISWPIFWQFLQRRLHVLSPCTF